jgi:hypothetical protein
VWACAFGAGGPARGENAKNRCGYEKKRNVTHEVAMMLGAWQRLRGHDGSVHDAGPDGKPDEAEVLKGVLGCSDEEDSESEIDPDEHLLVIRVVGAPPEPWGPEDEKDAREDREEAYDDKCNAESAKACHLLSLGWRWNAGRYECGDEWLGPPNDIKLSGERSESAAARC